ncbi:deoxyribonuclease-2 [Trichonephila inaurata madagascariensis]|uniref:Deoxyribonuclease-2 n=1 Tax=Trichonephila inaurata madagascariensis TaxID=2747483 RepID=A0A8X6XJZ2_9ARAC|nr:deoxyribonuclease-2 [Trichonephila inaurata madagascariensis]
MHCTRLYIATVFFLLFIDTSFSLRFGCKDESGEDVDWYVNYKIPKLEKGFDGTHLAEGSGYAYISSSRQGNWRLSSHSITSESSMLSKTLQQVFDNKREATYLFYNDEPPEGYPGTANGHLKGVVAFTGKSGFWLIHSIPKFSGVNEYNYPSNALVNGQSILCVTFNTTSLNEICNQLLHCSPKIYEHKLNDDVAPFLDNKTKTLFSGKPVFNRRPPFKRISPLKSSGKQMFISIAKDGQFKDDVYSSVIAPELRVSLATETWRRGSGTFLPPDCDSNYTVIDISQINMKVKDGNTNKNLIFSSTEDHSKWAVSTLSSRKWICVGDMNRMASQANRGGGALCFQSSRVQTAYRSLISDSDHCPA